MITLPPLTPHASYAGIGSRDTPTDVCDLMVLIAQKQKWQGWTLRSGGAQGADTAFEKGAGIQAEIYLPWSGFEGRRGPTVRLTSPSKRAEEIAAAYHPWWPRLSQGASVRPLLSRRVMSRCAIP